MAKSVLILAVLLVVVAVCVNAVPQKKPAAKPAAKPKPAAGAGAKKPAGGAGAKGPAAPGGAKPGDKKADTKGPDAAVKAPAVMRLNMERPDGKLTRLGLDAQEFTVRCEMPEELVKAKAVIKSCEAMFFDYDPLQDLRTDPNRDAALANQTHCDVKTNAEEVRLLQTERNRLSVNCTIKYSIGKEDAEVSSKTLFFDYDKGIARLTANVTAEQLAVVGAGSVNIDDPTVEMRVSKSGVMATWAKGGCLNFCQPRAVEIFPVRLVIGARGTGVDGGCTNRYAVENLFNRLDSDGQQIQSVNCQRFPEDLTFAPYEADFFVKYKTV